MKKYIFLAISALALSSCNDFLEREPLDFGSSESYYKSENDLRMAANDFYEMLPVNNASNNNGMYNEDIKSDNQCGPQAQDLLYMGNKRTVDVANSEWNFSNLRGVNFFIQKWYENRPIMTGSEIYLNHYLGEAYFFRAWDHFRLLRNFGDIPIIDKSLGDDKEELRAASLRYPRNEAARFIIAQLDSAANLLMANAPESGRLTKAAAYALKSRVALYEGTWEKYHAGTCFVPGNSKWVGKSTWPEFKFQAGSAEAEVNWFLEQAIDAAEKAVEGHGLYNDYLSMFNSIDVSGMPEVILARYYLPGVLAHNCSYYLRNGGGCGVTRQAVHTYLMQNGLPIYADGSGYKGDTNSYLEFTDRDPRLTGKRNADGSYPMGANGRYTGYGVVRAAGNITDADGNVLFNYAPFIYNSGQDKATTGYELNKWVTSDDAQQVLGGTYTAVPLLRSAECYLDYIEAYYERYGNLGGNCDKYWKEIRTRAGVDTDYNKTIAATDLTKEEDFGVWSKGKEVDPTLYNIRRERRCELIAEGRRLDDLKRWRAFDKMVRWQPEGFNLWDEVYTMYTDQQLSNGISDKGLSKYIRPLQANLAGQAYNGYTFPKPHYLEPIPISEFTLTIGSNGTSILYQNPGWPANTAGTADYSYDCD